MRGYLFSVKFALAIAICGLVALTPAVAADHDNDHDQSDHHDEHEYGAFIYEGTCDHISNTVVADVGDLGADDDHDVWRVVGQGTPTPSTVYGEDEDINPSIADLTGRDHVLVIRADDNQRAAVVACGEITGSPDANGALTIELHEVDRSGIEGRAVFRQHHDSHDRHEQTEVTTAVWHTTRGAPAPTPGAMVTSTATATATP